MKTKLVVEQTKSEIGQRDGMRVTLRSLGLRGPGTKVTLANTPSFRGAIKKIIHLVRVDETDAT